MSVYVCATCGRLTYVQCNLLFVHLERYTSRDLGVPSTPGATIELTSIHLHSHSDSPTTEAIRHVSSERKILPSFCSYFPCISHSNGQGASECVQ